MLPGYNHNVMHRGRVYHVQTEDSGPRNPVIITHLFVGGTILATRRVGYEDALSRAGLEDIVRERMQEQHKAMLKSLVSGAMDHLLGEGGVEPVHPPVLAASVAPPAPHLPHPAPHVPHPAPHVPHPAPRLVPPRPAAVPTSYVTARSPAADRREARVPAHPPPRPPPPHADSRAAHTTPVVRAQGTRVPSRSRPEASIAPVIVIGAAEPGARVDAGAPPRVAPGSGPPPAEPVRAPLDLGARFGAELISDKSLDEVILQYLSEELTLGGKK